MTKRISLNDWTYIGKYNPAAKWLRPLCSYTLTKINNGFRRECKMGWVIYLLMFLPVHLLQMFYCMWDGGLREFEFQGRYIGSDDITEHGDNCSRYPMAKEVWERN
jgi:hypothetical protein